MMSEAEAKEKWCPQARAILAGRKEDKGPLQVSDQKTSYNMVLDQTKKGAKDFYVKCIGAGCMAWRWAEKSALEVPMTGDVMARKGYCGAYGKPDFPDRDE